MSVNTNKWLKFFTEAGLPSNVATNYAIIFTDHRIQNDMLCDLTKEILYDMGIKTMGDVIAILRHAKSVHHETTREKMLGTSVNEVGSTSRLSQPSIGSTSRLTQSSIGSTSRLTQPSIKPKTNLPQVSTQNIISLKRSAQTSVKSTVPKIRRIISPEEEDDYNEDIDCINEQKFGPNKILGLESLKSSSAKTSVFSRLGNEKNSETISSIFTRLGNNTNSSSETLNPKRRVTISGNGINTSRVTDNNVTQNSLFVRKTVTNKKIVLAPKTGGLRSTQNETVSVKNRIGINTNSSNMIPTTNRLIVNRSIGSSLTVNRGNASSSVAQAKKIALRRAAAQNNKKTISLRKNIFDRLGPISL